MTLLYYNIQYTMLIGIAIEIPFAIGEMILGLEAYYIRDWKTLQIVAYLPVLGKDLFSLSNFLSFISQLCLACTLLSLSLCGG